MVDWIDEPDDDYEKRIALDDEEDDDEETFTCPSCNSALTFDEGDICPVCGEPLDDAEPDAEAEHGAQRAALWGAWR